MTDYADAIGPQVQQHALQDVHCMLGIGSIVWATCKWTLAQTEPLNAHAQCWTQ